MVKKILVLQQVCEIFLRALFSAGCNWGKCALPFPRSAFSFPQNERQRFSAILQDFGTSEPQKCVLLLGRQHDFHKTHFS